MVIGNIITDQALQVEFIEDEYMVGRLFVTTSHTAFRDSTSPGASVANSLWLNAAGNQEISHILAKR